MKPKRRKFNKIIDCDDFKKLETSKGELFLIDTDDLDLVLESMWCISATGYVVSRRDGRIVKLHRLLMGDPKNRVIDHINGNELDNRKENLRITEQRYNSRNVRKKKNNRSGYPGVRLRKSGNYQARIMLDRKEINIGMFKTFEEAKEARIKAEDKYFGEFAPSRGAIKQQA